MRNPGRQATLRRLARWSILTAVVAAIGMAVHEPIASALHRQTPAIHQPSQHTSGDTREISSWSPGKWAFSSSGDVLGNGNALFQIFLYNHTARMLQGKYGMTQVTCGTEDASHPSISASGTRIAFEANGDLCADPGHNCDALATPTTGRQIFLYDDDTGYIRQITNCPGDCTNPTLSGNGMMLLFESNVMMPGNTVSTDTFLYQGNIKRVGLGGCRQLPCGFQGEGITRVVPVGAQNGSQSFSGKFVAFESSHDPTGGGAVGVSQIYQKDMKTGAIEQITSSPAGARHPALTRGGKVIFYEQGSPSQIWWSKKRIRGAREYKQITTGFLDSFAPKTDPIGRRIAFLSESDLLGLGVPGVQAYSYDALHKTIRQITAGPNGATFATATLGVFLAFRSQDDYLGNGNTVPQFFIANLTKDPPGGIPSPQPTDTPGLTPTPVPTPSATPTIIANEPANVALALVVNEGVDNGDNTLTTVIAATVGDYFGNPVPDGTFINFSMVPTTDGVVISNGTTNSDPGCDISGFVAKTGVPIHNRVGVVHVCLTYVGGLAGSKRTIFASGSPNACMGGSNDLGLCSDNADCPPLHSCSISAATCVADTDCPAGETCTQHDGSCLPARRCVGGSADKGICFDDLDCPTLGLCSNSISVCDSDVDCPGATCVAHPGSCQLAALGSGEFRLPLPHNDCTQVNAPCSDFDPCTTSDVCILNPTTTGMCFGGTNDGVACTTEGQCPDRRECVGGTNVGTPCTTETDCPDLKVCLGGSNDQAFCTTDLDCFLGSCAVKNPGSCVLKSEGTCELPDPIICQPGPTLPCPDDGDLCTVDVCNFFTGECGKAPDCPPDGNPCTTDMCNPLDGACGIPNADPCDTDYDVCTDDMCDGTTGTCVHTPNVAPCEDGNPCTTADTCSAGLCVSGATTPCPDDGNDCTLDECNPSTASCGIRLEPCGCSAP